MGLRSASGALRTKLGFDHQRISAFHCQTFGGIQSADVANTECTTGFEFFALKSAIIQVPASQFRY